MMENGIRLSENNEESEKLTLKIKNKESNDDIDALFPIPNFGIDVGDVPLNKALVTKWDLFWICVSILTHLIDIGADLNLARSYYVGGMIGYFIWTVVFLFIPSFINIIVSIRMYNQDREAKPENNKKPTLANKIVHNVLYWPAILIFQLAPVLRYIDCFNFALKTHNYKIKDDNIKQKKYYLKMLKEEQDIALLRVFECFLEAAPHQILQLTIMIINHDEQNINSNFIHQCISILSSLIGMGWAMASYHRSIRLAQWDKENISEIGSYLQFFWHFFITVSRIVSISAAATVFTMYTSIVAILHWFIMTVWILLRPSGVEQFCRDLSKPPHSRLTIIEKIKSWLLASVFGVISIFTYLKPSEGTTYWRHFFYYVICGIENILACLIWIYYDVAGTKWYYELIIILCTAPFILGMSFMIIYYQFFHPTTKKCCVNQ